MKTKIFPVIFIVLIYLFPFRYAVLDPTSSNTINLLCGVTTIIGTLIFMLIAMDDGAKHEKNANQVSHINNSSVSDQQAA